MNREVKNVYERKSGRTAHLEKERETIKNERRERLKREKEERLEKA